MQNYIGQVTVSGFSITTIGEALIDWVCLDKTLDLYEATQFIKSLGGAPANVSIGLAKLNYPVQFIGGFSKDLYGIWLKESMSSYNIDLTYSVDILKSNTRNAYILTDKTGNRVLKGFSNYCCADSLLEPHHINNLVFTKSPVVYFGSLIQSMEPSKSTLNNIIESIMDTHVIVYDPNLRTCLWENKCDAIKTVTETFDKVDVVKLSDDEISLFAPNRTIEDAARMLFDKYKFKLLVVTLGSKGSFFINKNGSGFVKSFTVDTVEETGAGDGFVAGILGQIFDMIADSSLTNDQRLEIIANLSPNVLNKMLFKANAIGALTTTKPGATTALPTSEELEMFLNSHQ